MQNRQTPRASHKRALSSSAVLATVNNKQTWPMSKDSDDELDELDMLQSSANEPVRLFRSISMDRSAQYSIDRGRPQDPTSMMLLEILSDSDSEDLIPQVRKRNRLRSEGEVSISSFSVGSDSPSNCGGAYSPTPLLSQKLIAMNIVDPSDNNNNHEEEKSLGHTDSETKDSSASYSSTSGTTEDIK